MEHYLHVLWEAAWNASLIPLGQEPTLAAMQSFGGFNMPLATAIAVSGATAGQMFNWWVGTLLLKLKNKKGAPQPWDEKAAALFNKYGIYVLLLSWVPLGKLLPVIAGFLGTRPKVAFVLILFGEIFNYGRLL